MLSTLDYAAMLKNLSMFDLIKESGRLSNELYKHRRVMPLPPSMVETIKVKMALVDVEIVGREPQAARA